MAFAQLSFALRPSVGEKEIVQRIERSAAHLTAVLTGHH
jgi:hypothetical protein